MSGFIFGLAMYFKNLQIWFISRKEGHPHKCNSAHHAQRDANDLTKHLREKFLSKE